METNDDPEFKFDDDDDDSMLAAVLPDSVTKPAENSSSADVSRAVLGNPVQRLPSSTQTDPHPCSQASQLPQPNTAGPHPSSQGSQLPQLNTDHGPGESGDTLILVYHEQVPFFRIYSMKEKLRHLHCE